MKKHLKKLLVLILILPMFFVLTACGSTSAYDIAVKNGFVGTEEDWLNSLRGKSAYELAVDNGFVGTEEDWLKSLKGVDGLNGKDGSDAPQLNTLKMWEDACNSGNFDGTYMQFLQKIVGETNYDNSAKVVSENVMSVLCLYAQNSKAVEDTETHAVRLDPAISGSAVIYKYNDDGTCYVVTNYHMTYTGSGTQYRYYYLLSYDETIIIEAEYVGGSINHDVAVLKIGTAGTTYLKNCGAKAITLAEQIPGEVCYAIGNTEDCGLNPASGLVGVISEVVSYRIGNKNIPLRIFRHTAYTSHGNSGGALFNSNGAFIGMTNGGYDGTLMSFAIPTNIVAGVADNVIENFERGLTPGLSFGTLGLQLEEQPRKNSAGDIVITKDVFISEIKSSGLAQRVNLLNAGTESIFSVGDKLISVSWVNKNKSLEITRDYNLSELLLCARVGDEISVKLEHNGKQIEISFVLTLADATKF